MDDVEDGLPEFSDQLKIFGWEMLDEPVSKYNLA